MRYDKVARRELRSNRNLVCARYVGTRADLRNATALVRLPRRKDEPTGMLMAQFDGFGLAPLCYGWHPFRPNEFKLRPSISGTADRLLAEFRSWDYSRNRWRK